MSNDVKYSDDISGLWGSGGNGILDPAPMGTRKRSGNGSRNGTGTSGDPRDDLDGRISLVLDGLAALERRLGRLEDSIDARDRKCAGPSRLGPG